MIVPTVTMFLNNNFTEYELWERYITSLWFQPIWKKLVKMGIFPK